MSTLLRRLTAQGVVGLPVLGGQRRARPHRIVEPAIELRGNGCADRPDFPSGWRCLCGCRAPGRGDEDAKDGRGSYSHSFIPGVTIEPLLRAARGRRCTDLDVHSGLAVVERSTFSLPEA